MKTVLILDDDPTILGILGRQFQALGADVLTCREIEAAEAVLDVLPIDRVLTDLCVSALGGLEGTRLLRHVTALAPDAEIFAMSGHLDARIRDIVEALGVVDAFQKPFNPGQLARRVLAGRRGEPPAPEGCRGELRTIDPLATFLASGRLHALLQPVVALRPAAAPFPMFGMEGFAAAPADCPLGNPAILFGLAARKDRLVQTDLLCVRATLAEAGHLGRSLRLFINVHPRSLAHPDFAGGFMEEVATAGREPASVVIELSEREAALGRGSLEAALSTLRKAGFRTSLDNYGEGSSNLKLLLDVKPDFVKLAGSLTAGIDVDPLQREAVRSTRDMLSRLGIRTILSRIETSTELDAALELGLELGQGWHFSRPLRADALQAAGAFSGPAHGAAARAGSHVSPFAIPA